MSSRFDLVVRNGTVIDGTGSDPRTADVAVRDPSNILSHLSDNKSVRCNLFLTKTLLCLELFFYIV